MLLCWRGCKQILFDVVVESNRTHRLRRLASFKRLCYLKMVQSFFDGVWGGGGRGTHVKGVDVLCCLFHDYVIFS